MPLRRQVGTATVIALEDGFGTFFRPRVDAFPGCPDDLWQRADAFDPDAVTEQGDWLLRFRCFAIRLESGETILVDTGIGHETAPASAWAPTPGELPASLAAADLAPADISAVVLTHLHTDHIGWSVLGNGEPYFPNARYVLQRAELTNVGPRVEESVLEPLRGTGQLHLVDGATPLGRGVSTVATPGHTPGHQSVLVDDGGDSLLVAGDLLVHAVQLLHPAQPYALEADPAQARASREAMFAKLAEVRGTIATAHLTAAFHELTPTD